MCHIHSKYAQIRLKKYKSTFFLTQPFPPSLRKGALQSQMINDNARANLIKKIWYNFFIFIKNVIS